jgi:hypothetical protein
MRIVDDQYAVEAVRFRDNRWSEPRGYDTGSLLDHNPKRGVVGRGDGPCLDGTPGSPDDQYPSPILRYPDMLAVKNGMGVPDDGNPKLATAQDLTGTQELGRGGFSDLDAIIGTVQDRDVVQRESRSLPAINAVYRTIPHREAPDGDALRSDNVEETLCHITRLPSTSTLEDRPLPPAPIKRYPISSNSHRFFTDPRDTNRVTRPGYA